MTTEQAKLIKILVQDFECSERQVHKVWQKIYVPEEEWYSHPNLKRLLPVLKEKMKPYQYEKYFRANTPSGHQSTGRSLIKEAEELLNENLYENN